MMGLVLSSLIVLNASTSDAFTPQPLLKFSIMKEGRGSYLSVSQKQIENSDSGNRNSFMHFVNTSEEDTESTERARGIPYQFYIMTHDERSCTVTAQQFASQMIELQNMKNIPIIDTTIPYDAPAKYYYEQSEKIMSFKEFKMQYISSTIEKVKEKRKRRNSIDEKKIPSSNDKRSIELGIDFSDTDNSSEESTTFKLSFGDEISDLILRPESDLIDTGLVMMSSLLVALLTLPIQTYSEGMYSLLLDLSEVLNYFFFFGFFLRWYAVGQLSPMYFTKVLPLIDIFASVLPVILTTVVLQVGQPNIEIVDISSSALVNLRLLRLGRIQQMLVDIETFKRIGEVLGVDPNNVRPYQLKLARVIITIFTLCSVSTGLIYTAEHGVNEAIPDYFTALYFGLTTVSFIFQFT